jgi:hypothetical protein
MTNKTEQNKSKQNRRIQTEEPNVNQNQTE